MENVQNHMPRLLTLQQDLLPVDWQDVLLLWDLLLVNRQDLLL